MLRRPVLLGTMLVLLTVPTLAWAGAGADFDGQLGNAWGQCRDALYHSSPRHQDSKAATEALHAFLAAWRRLEDQWAGQPPPQYGEDQDFAQELRGIAEIATDALYQAEAGAPTQAYTTLQQVRALLGELRRKNGLTSFADQALAFEEKLAETADDLFDQPELTADQQLLLLEQSAQLAYLAERLEKQAPPNLADNANFLEMAEGLAADIRGLRAAALAGQREPIVAILADLRRSFDIFDRYYG